MIYRITIAGAEEGGQPEATVERITADADSSTYEGVEVRGHVSLGGLLQTCGRVIHEWSLRPSRKPRDRQ